VVGKVPRSAQPPVAASWPASSGKPARFTGHLILTQTPSGAGQALDPRHFLKQHDEIRIEIEKLGVIRHKVG
jgi:hypothetical protein